MSIQNVNLTPMVPTQAAAVRPAGVGERRGTPAPAERATAAPAHAAEARRAPSAASAVPAEAPAGTDPELWSVLTTEERAFFAKFHAAGPLTYGPRTASPAEQAIARGRRLDVTV
ncbi:MAG: hypothetical protein IRZ00_05780 [Gemmatimonadetes bacterium]|nr:hypothetical protein [Gemmatimonadota bacterium]